MSRIDSQSVESVFTVLVALILGVKILRLPGLFIATTKYPLGARWQSKFRAPSSLW